MRKIRTIILQEVDEAGEIQALKIEAAKRITSAPQPPAFKPGDIIRITTHRRKLLSYDQIGVIVQDPDIKGEYGILVVNNAGDFQIATVRRNEMKLHNSQQKLISDRSQSSVEA